jgi:hypothetical protein
MQNLRNPAGCRIRPGFRPVVKLFSESCRHRLRFLRVSTFAFCRIVTSPGFRGSRMADPGLARYFSRTPAEAALATAEVGTDFPGTNRPASGAIITWRHWKFIGGAVGIEPGLFFVSGEGGTCSG